MSTLQSFKCSAIEIEGRDDHQTIYITMLALTHEKNSVTNFRRSGAKIDLTVS